MSEIIVFPSDALFLGLCVGEYETQIQVEIEDEAKDVLHFVLDWEMHFMKILRTRFFPLYPDEVGTGRWNTESLSESEIPDDVKWKWRVTLHDFVGRSASIPDKWNWGDLENDSKIGLASTHDRFLYIRTPEGKYQRRSWNPWSEKSLPYWLVSKLVKYLGLTLCDVIDFLPGGIDELSYEAAFATYCDYCLGFFEMGTDTEDQFESEEMFIEPIREETPSAVVDTIERIVSRNGCDEIFQIGRRFGQLLVLLPRLPESLEDHFVLHPDGESFRAVQVLPSKLQKNEQEGLRVREAIDEIMSSSILKSERLPFDLVFNNLRRVVTGEYYNELDSRRFISRTETMTMLLWVAFAQIFFAIKEKDDESRQQDAEKVTPRDWMRVDVDIDTIRQQLKYTEYYLNLAKSDEEAPGFIGMASDAVEALCKRFWPEEFAYRDARLGKILSEKRQSNNQFENRFASIATTLYHSYRNRRSHEMESFRCTRREAKFVLSGLQAMLDLLELEQN